MPPPRGIERARQRRGEGARVLVVLQRAAERAAAARDENAAGGRFLAGLLEPGRQVTRVRALGYQVVHVPGLRDFDGGGGLVRVRVRVWV